MESTEHLIIRLLKLVETQEGGELLDSLGKEAFAKAFLAGRLVLEEEEEEEEED